MEWPEDPADHRQLAGRMDPGADAQAEPGRGGLGDRDREGARRRAGHRGTGP